MAFRVNEFRSQMVNDGARPNLFRCEVTFPIYALSNLVLGGGANGGSSVPTKLTFMARSSQLPGTSVGAVPLSYFGRELKFAGNRTFPEWTITVINDEDFLIRRAFEKWLNGINSHYENLRTPEFTQGEGGYQQDGRIYQYSKTGDVLKKYNFIGMFPIDVSPIEVDWASNDTIEEFAVTFAYQWWESDTTDGTTNTAPVEG